VVIVILSENGREQDTSSIKSFNLYMPGIWYTSMLWVKSVDLKVTNI